MTSINTNLLLNESSNYSKLPSIISYINLVIYTISYADTLHSILSYYTYTVNANKS